MEQIEPIEIFGFENKGVFLKMYGQHPFSDNKTLKAQITDVFGNVLFTRILVYGTTEEVAQQLGLTLIKNNNMAQTSSIEWVLQYLNNAKPNEFCLIEKIIELLQQAKEMHKEEIKTAFNHGMNCSSFYFIVDGKDAEDENYYNETFKTKE